MSLALFKTILARALGEERLRELFGACRGRCWACVEGRLQYWYLRWITSTLPDPELVIEDIEKNCLPLSGGEGGSRETG